MPSSSEARPSRARRSGHCLSVHAGALAALACAVAVLGPLLWSRGFLLRYDLVFTPRLPFSATTLGVAGQVPRAVPNDAVVALLDLVLPGDVTQKLILAGAFVAIGAGVDRVTASTTARVSTTVALCWSPWIAERLSIGHWGYLWGFAATVWAFAAALACRNRQRVGATTTRVALVMGALSGSTGAVLVALTLSVMVLAPGPGRVSVRRWCRWAALWLALDAAWWFAFLALAPSGAADAAGVTAFAAKADGAGGVMVSVLGGGGIWHPPSWFAERASWPVALAAAILLTAGVCACWRRRHGRAMLACAGLGLTLALAGVMPGLRSLVTAVVLHVPGGGLLRDGQKFAALWVIPGAFGFGWMIEGLRRRGLGTVVAPVAVVAGTMIPIALLPGLAWAHGGNWQAATYPGGWARGVALADARGGSTAVLPWSTYRRFAWNGDRVVLDPWNRLLRVPTVSDDSLPLNVGGKSVTVRGESAAAERLGRAVHAAAATDAPSAELADALRAAGVRTVIVQTDQPDAARQSAAVLRAGGALLQEDRAAHLDVLAVEAPEVAPAQGEWRWVGLAVSIGALVALGVSALGRRPDRLGQSAASKHPQR